MVLQFKKPLEIIFQQSSMKLCIESGAFPTEWEKGNIVAIQGKRDKKALKNYSPLSLLPICGQILERLLFNEMFKFLNLFHQISPVLKWVIFLLVSCYLSLVRNMNLLMTKLKLEASSRAYIKSI